MDVGRGPVGLADHGRKPRGRETVFDCFDLRRGNIAKHVARSKIAPQAAQANEIGAQLVGADLCRDVERGISLLAHDPVRRDAVPELERTNRRLDGRVEDVVHAVALVEIALDDKAVAERGHGLMAKSGLQQADRRDSGPPALRSDRFVARDDLLGHLDGLWTESRRPGLAAGRREALGEHCADNPRPATATPAVPRRNARRSRTGVMCDDVFAMGTALPGYGAAS